MKALTLLLITSQLLSSCYTYTKLTNEIPITSEFLATLEAEKTYNFELKSGLTLTILVTCVELETVSGYYSVGSNKKMDQEWSSTFEDIKIYVTSISERKFNPRVTAVGLGMAGFVSLIILLRVWVANDCWDNQC